ncbi:hypothetical protein ES703_104390 [subsurface metagenome]
MVKCLLCEAQGITREFKSKSGLAGHIQISHPGAVLVDGAELRDKMEGVFGRMEKRMVAVEAGLELMSKAISALNEKGISVLGERLVKVESGLLDQFFSKAALHIDHLESFHGAKVDWSEYPPEVQAKQKEIKEGQLRLK